MKVNYDVIVIGAGPGGIFAAMEFKKNHPTIDVLVLEQGKRLEKRYCPIEKTGACLQCKPFCHITNGFSGAGAFSDGKLSLFNPEDDDIPVGGELHSYIGVKKTQELISYVDDIYVKFGADKKLEGTAHKDEINEIRAKAKKNDIELVNIPIRHLGTEKSHELYGKIQNHLLEIGVVLKTDTVVTDLIIKDGRICGAKTLPAAKYIKNEIEEETEYFAPYVVISVGRKGAKWMFDMCARHQIKNSSGVVDIGIRYELPDKIMQDINTYMYEGKFIGYPLPYRDKVRTFCQNPSGFVSSEVYDNNLTIVNGHSYKDHKSTNTNLAILVSHEFKYPFDQPIKFGRNIAVNTNDLGQGNILVQRFGDILRGKRTWEHELKNNTVQPTLKCAAAGDVTSALPYRTMLDIINFIMSMDKVVEGFAHYDNLLYAPEIKFYSNKVTINNRLETSIENLYCIGDTGGLTRGLMMASCSGVAVARNIIKKL